MSRALAGGARQLLWSSCVLVFAALVGIAAASGGSSNPRALYLILLFTICSSPLLLMRSFNGPYSILAVMMPVLFVYYGGLDIVNLFAPGDASGEVGVMTAAEAGILAAAALIVLGHALAVRLGRRRAPARAPAREWPPLTCTVVGVTLWGLGVFATYVWQVEILNRAFADVSSRVGAFEGMAVALARTLQPLGLLLVAYRVVVGRNAVITLLLLVMLGIEFVVGFVGDSKEVAMRGLALVLVTSFLVRGKAPRTWLAVATVVVVVAFPVFQAYRTEVLSGGRDRGKAAENLGRNLERALESRHLESDDGLYTWRSFLDRASLKPTMTRIVRDVGTVARFQSGDTLTLYFAGMVPRVFWPDKPDASVGQKFNRELKISQFRDVYISVTQLGELYWNFGWAGLLCGSALMGLLLGFVNVRCDLAAERSVTRLLVICVTIYLVAIRMEDNIAMTYLVWTRSLLAILLLHLLFARRRPAARAAAAPRRNDDDLLRRAAAAESLTLGGAR